MSRIEEIHGTSQDVLYVFDFMTLKRTAFIDYHNKLVHADLSGKDFDPLLCFPFLENVVNPDRKVEDRVLDCIRREDNHVTMEVLPGLIKAMPKVDPDTIYFHIGGPEKQKGESIYWGDIGFILVYASVQEKCSTVIKDDKLYIRVDPESEPESLPEDFHKPKPKRKAKVLRFPKYPTTPKDWMKYAEKVVGGSNLKPIARQIYRRSKRMYLKDVPHYPKETTRRGCYYFCGVVFLARVAGVSVDTITRVLKALAEAKLIYIRYHGYKGRGCSIIEVPPNMKLVMRWRREHKR